MFVVHRELKAKQNLKTLSISPKQEVRTHGVSANGWVLGDRPNLLNKL
jgi:hypothetical protein